MGEWGLPAGTASPLDNQANMGEKLDKILGGLLAMRGRQCFEGGSKGWFKSARKWRLKGETSPCDRGEKMSGSAV